MRRIGAARGLAGSCNYDASVGFGGDHGDGISPWAAPSGGCAAGRRTARPQAGHRPTLVQDPLSGPNVAYAFDTMGRLNTMGDNGTATNVINATSYGPSNELLSMTGLVSETRTYNSMLQLTQLTNNAANITYAYSATQNNGKITSQTDNISGEQVQYTYDALNRLASALATSNSWGQSYNYDGFGNLTDQNVTAGSAPSYHVVFNAANNRVNGDCADANGNEGACVGGTNTFDIENRLVAAGPGQNGQYAYAPGNKRAWRGVWTSGTLTTDEVTFWGVSGQKLGAYALYITGGITGIGQSNAPSVLNVNQTSTNYYFGGKLIKNATGYIGADRLGSIGKYYPYGQEKPSATTNGTEKFTGYMRDAETGLDYADQRYHSPGTGRFMTADPSKASGTPTKPGSWNRYAYSDGDPINSRDPFGLYSTSASSGVGLTSEYCSYNPNDPDCENTSAYGSAVPGRGGPCTRAQAQAFESSSEEEASFCAGTDEEEDNSAPTCDEQLITTINQFTAGSPMGNLGAVFVKYGQEFNVDPRFVAALAVAESSLGRNQGNACNDFGYFWKGYGVCSPFDSYNTEILSVTKNIRRRHLNPPASETTAGQVYNGGGR